MPGFWKALGEALGLTRDGFDWWSNPLGYEQWKKEREGKRLQADADERFETWTKEQTSANWLAYKEALAALDRHSNTD